MTLRRLVPALLVLVSLTISSMGEMSVAVQAQNGNKIYLPSVPQNYPRNSPFGFEMFGRIADPFFVTRAQELGATWIRLNRVSWRSVQPNENGAYNWSALEGFERDLAAAVQAGLTPMVTISDSPEWATIPLYNSDGSVYHRRCAAVRSDRFEHFARFVEALVTRYKLYNVQYWELGNEPDVDPGLLPPDAIWGCWGNQDNEFYGGEHYGNMLKVVGPAIKRANPEAKVLIGGLLVANPNLEPTNGKYPPARFLQGILKSGAAPFFDIIPYHAHFSYYGAPIDYTGKGGGWERFGGPAKGKPAFLKQIMAEYGVSKPLFLNEASLGCPDDSNQTAQQRQLCASSSGRAALQEVQADHVARMIVPTLNVDVLGVIWYTLDGEGWRNGGLLNMFQTPRPAFRAYQRLIAETEGASMPPSSVGDYGSAVEAYRFNKKSSVVDVAWSIDGTADLVRIPQSHFLGAYSRDGAQLSPSFHNGHAELLVNSSPVYIRRRP